MDLRDRSVVITGASKGIGAALARRLAERGARLTLAARGAAALEQVAADCGARALAVPTDVTDPDECRRLVGRAAEEHGGIDVLVNNAGVGMWARFDQVTDLSVFERLMKVNYLGAVYSTFHALPELRKSRGMICAVSSLTGKTGVPTRTGYAASKHAMQGFFDSLRVELRHTGVDVLVVSPGFVATEIRNRALGADGQPIGTSMRDESKNNMPVEAVVDAMVRALERRRREAVLPPVARVGMALKLVAPGLVDWFSARLIGDPGR